MINTETNNLWTQHIMQTGNNWQETSQRHDNNQVPNNIKD